MGGVTFLVMEILTETNSAEFRWDATSRAPNDRLRGKTRGGTGTWDENNQGHLVNIERTSWSFMQLDLHSTQYLSIILNIENHNLLIIGTDHRFTCGIFDRESEVFSLEPKIRSFECWTITISWSLIIPLIALAPAYHQIYLSFNVLHTQSH